MPPEEKTRSSPALIAVPSTGQSTFSITQTCHLNHIEPFAYLKDILECIVSGQTKANQIDELMPWN